MLTLVPAQSRGADRIREIEALYCDAFPERERVPFRIFTDPARYELLALEEDGAFRGFAACRERQGLASLIYFAVLPAFRSRGLGGEALEAIARRFAGTRLFIDIENPFEEAPDRALRERRLRFYARHGFEDTGITEAWQGVNYRILSLGGAVTAAEVEAFWASGIPDGS